MTTPTPPDFEFNPAYYNVVDQIYHAPWAAHKLSRLTLLQRWIEQLWPHGHPTQLLHVAGTSGKGSTTRLLETALGLLGPAGGYYSPHLFDYRERFSLNGQYATPSDITTAWEQVVLPLCIEAELNSPLLVPTFPEIALLIALVLFERHAVQWAAIETGLGGRYDQTSALNVAATLLTNVGNDHEHLLGSELWQRVLDKAGIARRNVPFFTTAQGEETLAIITRVCEHVGAPLHIITPQQIGLIGQQISATLSSTPSEHPLLNAPYQHANATLALAALLHLFPSLSQADIVQRFGQARLSGRFWQVAPNLYADVAHNPDKLRALAQHIQTEIPATTGKLFVLGISGQRQPQQMYDPLLPLARAVVLTSGFYRAQPTAALQAALHAADPNLPLHIAETPVHALALARQLQQPGEVIILTGSTYMIEQALNTDPYLQHINLNYGWRDK